MKKRAAVAQDEDEGSGRRSALYQSKELLNTVCSWWHQLLFCHVCDKDLLLKGSLKRESQSLMRRWCPDSLDLPLQGFICGLGHSQLHYLCVWGAVPSASVAVLIVYLCKPALRTAAGGSGWLFSCFLQAWKHWCREGVKMLCLSSCLSTYSA